jgi:hypothetical protein
LRRPAARKETGAQDRQANPDPPANGKAPRTWCVCQWPNEVHASALRPARAECAHLRAFKVHPRCSNRLAMLQHTRITVTTMTEDQTIVDALASYTGTVTRCPAGRASASERSVAERSSSVSAAMRGRGPTRSCSGGCGVGDGDESRCGCSASDVNGCCDESRSWRLAAPPPLKNARPSALMGPVAR